MTNWAEDYMTAIGRSRYRGSIQRQREHGRLSDTPAGRQLLANAIPELSEAIESWIKVTRKDATAGAREAEILDTWLKPEVAALITAWTVVDNIETKEVRHRFIASAIGRRIADEIIAIYIRKHQKLLYRNMARQLKFSGELKIRSHLLKQANDPTNGVEAEVLPATFRTKIGEYLLAIFIGTTGFVELEKVPERKLKGRTFWVWHLTPNPELLEWVQECHDSREALAVHYLPTTEPPEDWVTPFSGGYSKEVSPLRKMVRASFPLVHSAFTVDRVPDVYHSINALQQTRWKINEDLLEVLKTLWSEGNEVAGLPRKEPEEIPDRIEGATPDEIQRWRQNARHIHANNRVRSSKRLQLMWTIRQAERYSGVDTFWMPHYLDFRGRVYPQSNYLTYQGSDYQKGLLTFSHGMPVAGVGAQWYKRHGANVWGIDKVPFAEREAWVDSNWKTIRAISEDPLSNREWLDADKPWQALAWCLEAPGVLEEGLPSYLPCSVDGSSNGIQILSIITGDLEGAKDTNVIPSETVMDIYSKIASARVYKAMEEEGGRHWERLKPYLEKHFEGDLPRSCTKRPCMTLPYGVTRHSCLDYVAEWFQETPGYHPNLWGNSKARWKTVRWLATHVWNGIEEHLPRTRQFMEWLQSAARQVSKAGACCSWYAPNGWLVQQGYQKWAGRVVKTTFKTKSVFIKQVMSKRPVSSGEVAVERQVRGSVPNFVHSLDAAALHRTVNRCTEQGITDFAMVHDSFGCHAAHLETMSRELRAAYQETLSGDILGNLKRDLEFCVPGEFSLGEPPEFGSIDLACLADSKYFFA